MSFLLICKGKCEILKSTTWGSNTNLINGMYLSTHTLQYSTGTALSLSHREILHGKISCTKQPSQKLLRTYLFILNSDLCCNQLNTNMALRYCDSLSRRFRPEPATCVVDNYTFLRSLFLTTLSPSFLLNLLACGSMAVEHSSPAPVTQLEFTSYTKSVLSQRLIMSHTKTKEAVLRFHSL